MRRQPIMQQSGGIVGGFFAVTGAAITFAIAAGIALPLAHATNNILAGLIPGVAAGWAFLRFLWCPMLNRLDGTAYED